MERKMERLLNIASNTDNQVKIASAGGIAPLIALLSSGDAVGKKYAAGVLWNLSFNTDNKVKTRSTGLQVIQTALNNKKDANVKSEIEDLLNKL